MQVIGTQTGGLPDTRVVVFTLGTGEVAIAAGGRARIEVAMFVGPRDSNLFAAQPYESLSFSQMVIYNLGGPCAFCTFQWLAKGMLAFMSAIHFVFRDWGVAVIILTLVVRGILHPITKRSQVSMTKMSKQMASIQPEVEKIKKKHKGDQQKIQAETMRLYREKGINPAGMLGCLPMFLQMPIWIALYAMLYYAIELRHEPAFYNVFHGISALWGGGWQFLTDLSSPDNFIKFAGDGYHIDLWLVQPHLTGINIIPILMAALFFLQQKYTTPPPANEQAAQQQKMMKWMTLLFPAFLYSAPSGLTLYIMASTAAGIVDSYIVKRHIKKEEEAGALFAPSPRKAGGLMDRIQ
jgi:YidC/Oxa1 family membrane protein insertase